MYGRGEFAMSAQGDARPALAPPAEPVAARYYVLFMLLLIYTSNFIDRTIIGTLAQPIKEELRLADWQLGLVSGLAFALFYSLLGLPIARLADRFNRVTIVSVSLAVWSVMTAVCGLAQNFAQLLLARAGVGIGEAGCTPPAHSIIADNFPPEQRASALGVFSLGMPLGSLFGALAAGWIATEYGWRTAFMIVGLPGVLLAVLLKLTVREPVRGRFDKGPPRTAIPYGEVLKMIFTSPALVFLFISLTLVAFSAFGLVVFAVPFLLRGFDLTLVEAASGYGLVAGVAAAIGTGGGGFVADFVGRRNPALRLQTPAIGLILAGPLLVAGLLSGDLILLGILAAVAILLRDLHVGPMLGLLQNSVPPQMRAQAAALLMVIMSLVGLGLGPLFVGWVSDVAASSAYAGAEAYALACAPGTPSAAEQACTQASSAGLRIALSVASSFYVVAGVLLWIANSSLRRRAA
jgi:MFS family permease